MKWEIFASAVVIDGTNNLLQFQEGGIGPTYTATLSPGTFYLTGTGGPEDLAKSIADDLEARSLAVGGSETYTIDYSGLITKPGRTGVVTITCSNDVELIASGSTFDFTVLGWPNADTGAATVITSPFSPTCTWVPDQPYILEPPKGRRGPRRQYVATDGKTVYTYNMGGDVTRRDWRWRILTADRVWVHYETAVNGQDETAFDNSPTTEGTFAGGTGHANTDVLTMSDGSLVTVDLVAAGVVTEFTISNTDAAQGVDPGDVLTQTASTGSGVGFSLTLDEDNVGSDPARTLDAFGTLISDGRNVQVYRVKQSGTVGTLATATARDLVSTYVLQMEPGYVFEPKRKRGGVPLYEHGMTGIDVS